MHRLDPASSHRRVFSSFSVSYVVVFSQRWRTVQPRRTLVAPDRRTSRMRTRQKITAVGALALATTAVGGGAVVTSHAMADAPTPEKGTMTVVSMMAGPDSAIKCVYDDIELPVAAQGHGVLGIEAGNQMGSIPAGAVIISDTVTPADGEGPGFPPNLTINKQFTGSVAIGGDVETALPVPPGAVVLDAADARPGTAEECAALKPTTIEPPLLTSP
jgi:hypothetical protein